MENENVEAVELAPQLLERGPQPATVAAGNRANPVVEAHSTRAVLATMAGGACSGSLARLPLHPLDTLKARLQAAPGAPSLPPSALAAVARDFVRAEGLRGLYRGFSVAFVGGAPASCLYFTTYELCKGWLAPAAPLPASQPPQASPAVHLLAGMVAEAVSCVLWVPIDVIKERLQVQAVRVPQAAEGTLASVSPPHYAGPIDAARQILRGEGLRGLYRGYGATLASFGPFSGLYLVCYEQLKALALRRQPPPLSVAQPLHQPQQQQLSVGLQVATASAAGAAASFLTSPLDLVKLRLQVQRGSGSGSGAGARGGQAAAGYAGIADGLRSIVRDEGWRALWRGAGTRVAYHAPSTALAMVLFERCRGAFLEVGSLD